jgi:hypothetical protein
MPEPVLLASMLALTTAGAITLAGAPANAAPTANDAGILVSSVEGISLTLTVAPAR